MEFVQLTSQQSDNFVNDISFDFYGRRFASCSTDGKIKVWDLNEEDNLWTSVEIEAHTQSIWRISWAHPEFGNLIASCSEDRTICIWEEQAAVSLSDSSENKERWVRKAQLTDSKKPVNDVKFAPKHLGLKFAAACADGFIRLYEATDVFSLNFWQLQHTIAVEETTASLNSMAPRKSEYGVVCLSWSDSVFEPARFVVGGHSRKAAVWSYDADAAGPNKWKEDCELDPRGTSGVIQDAAWAPAMGRSYHLVATASREPHFKIHTLLRKSDGSVEYSLTHTEAVSSPVWRVAWNATGTVLATSAEDGSLTLWRKDFAGTWKNVQELPKLEGTSPVNPNNL